MLDYAVRRIRVLHTVQKKEFNKREERMLFKRNMLKFFVFIFVVAGGLPLQAQASGDVNNDGTVNIVDALLIAQYYVGLNPNPFITSIADVNCDGTIGIVDALMVAQLYVGLITVFPCTATVIPTPIVTPASTAGINETPPPGSQSLSCAGKPVWNSQVVYNTTGQLVEYNCNLYQDQGFAYNLNPETNNGQYMQWLLVGACSDGNCTMGEGPFIGCGQYDKYVLGTWTVYNNVWGGTSDSQCLTAYSTGNWFVVSTQPATSGVKSYPNTGIVNVGRNISAIGTFTSSFNVAVPSSGDYEVAYDIWVPSEVMIWMHTIGNVGPIAASWDSSGKPVPSASNVTVGGHTWNVYHGGNNVVSFVRTSNTTSGTVDIKAVLNWIVSQGWFGDGTVGASQFGFEISGTGGAPLTFTCNSFSMTVN
jgi:hypothetical protein